ncbi:glucuronate isomerase [Modestobacter roseus]|uniref:Uronate isomerase n=1 Tax=Modestobacter roseus TaxID=1181884 RepID=A0A562IMK3_9ACTN|nr:glucuronate isomerase [Modestobacter roseus]MQA33751.1 glucuronate isomerase [Modestobacter roseus]TWH72066.1 glucuronate isomerase [Modestobacter roseus]
MPAPAVLSRHPDRLLPSEPGTRAIARRLYDAVRDLPILSPHGHVDPQMLADDVPFRDPASLFVTPDHYVTRLLHASGIPLGDLGVGRGQLTESESRAVWRRLCEHWHVLRGTPTRYWLESELAEVFDVGVQPSTDTADDIYDQVAERLTKDAYRPRALFERFRIEFLATTDDPCDDLSAHAALAADDSFPGRVVPTFRPDRYLEVSAPGWAAAVSRLGEVSGTDTGSWSGWVTAMEQRRAHFAAHGATSADHSHEDVRTDPLSPGQAEQLYRAALSGDATADECLALRRHMLLEMARMSCDDGLVMTLHPGVRRNHHAPTLASHGPDTGHDIPLRMEYTDALRPLLERFGTHPGLHLVLFTLDETVFSRELGPLAGFYPSVYVGAPWWFLDAPGAVRRFRDAVTESAGFRRTSGFIDDTRAFCSIPARHDMSRRLDSGYLARLVSEHLLDEDEALETVVDLVDGRPREVFKL